MADRAATGVGQRCPGCEAQTLMAHGLSPTHAYREGWTVSGFNSCGGVWVDARTLDAIIERAAQRATLNTGPVAKHQVAIAAEQVRYRGCPVCAQLMMRRNFARISGVVVDQCRQHGTWFDPGELDAVLRFVASGGLAAAHARETKELESERRRVTDPNPYAQPPSAMMWTPAAAEFALLDAFFAFLRGRRFWRF
jgi:Zn-finger nucleic acid-binding protein